MTSKSGKLYLHTDIRLIVSRKADLDTATALPPPPPRPPAPGAPGAGGAEGSLGCDQLRSVTCAPDNPKYSPR